MIRKLLIRIICTILAFVVGTGISALLSRHSGALPPPAPSSDRVRIIEIVPEQIDEVTSFNDLLAGEPTTFHNGYVIEQQYKQVQFEGLRLQDQGYIIVSQNGKVVRSFDATFYHPIGNSADFGFFSFLGSDIKQVAVSQSVPRGGTQWIVDLSATPQVIFDGEAWHVGREDSDCEVKDVDGDGVFEVSSPITDFYDLMDKIAVAGVPLPKITFKYDSGKKQYLPVNHILKTFQEAPELNWSNELYFRSAVLGYMLDLIYAGKRVEAWRYFHSTYNLHDKKEIERRVKAILKNQPVYKYIYKKR